MRAGTDQSTAKAITGSYLPPLDGLRGVAVLAVMIYHVSLHHRDFHSADPGFLLTLSQIGWAGVDVFFVLSGFLITSILLETKNHRHYFRNFFARRILRIWPLYYALLLVLLVLLPAMVPDTVLSPAFLSMREHAMWFWLFAANWLFAIEGSFAGIGGGVFWSLAVEEQFYLLWPFVVYFSNPRTLTGITIGMFAFSLLARPLMLALGFSAATTYAATFSHMDGLALGSLLAVGHHRHWLARVTAVQLWLAAFVCLTVLLAVWLTTGNLFFWEVPMSLFGYASVAVLSSVAMIHALRQNGKGSLFDRALSSSALVATGRYSYALYLLHVPIASMLDPLLIDLADTSTSPLHYRVLFLAYCAAALGLSWFAAVASWHILEKRVLSAKRHFSYGDPSADSASAPRAGS